MTSFWRREIRGVEVSLWRCTTWILLGVRVDRHPSECTVTVHAGPLSLSVFWLRPPRNGWEWA